MTTSNELRSSKFAQAFALWALAFIVSALIGTHGISYWDAGDYVLLALQGGKSGLLLGRPLFLWISRAVLAAGVDAAHAEVVLRWFWAAAGATAAPLLAVLATRLGLDRRAAFMAGVALAMSPSFAHANHQVLTDAPALALSIAALASAASGRALVSGLLLAAAVATRETAALNVVAICLLLGRQKSWIAVGVCTAVLIGVVLVYQPPALASWLAGMSRSAALHPWSSADVFTSLAWVVAAGPIAVIAGSAAILRGRMDGRLRAAVVPGVVATVLLLFYPDGSFSPRYMLAAVPVAFFLPASPWLAARPVIAGIALVLQVCVGAVAVYPANISAAEGAALMERIPQLPQSALVVPGHFCPQARLAAFVAKRSDLEFICTGWDWPPDLAARLDGALRDGRPVAVDVGSDAWVGKREADPHRSARTWTESHKGVQIADFTIVRR